MNENKRNSFPVIFETIENVDTRFTKVRCWLIHTSVNFNKCILEKDVVEQAIPTLSYIPIVGFIEQDKVFEEKDFTDHKYILTKKDGEIHKKYLGSAYGVIMSNADNNAHFEKRMADDGNEYEYLVVDGIMWNQFEDSAEIMQRDLIKKHSVELDENSIDGYEDENGIFHFTKFSFKAACILGNDPSIEPAMIGSTVEVMFTMSNFVKDLQRELNDKYDTFTKLIKENNQGGTDMPVPNENENATTDFSTTMLQQFNDFSIIVSQFEKMNDIWGDEVSRYTLVDIQDNEVICMDRQNNYQYVGFTFSMNGDKPEIDFACGNRKKVNYVNYEEGTVENFNIGDFVNNLEEVSFSKLTKAEEKITESEQKIQSIESEKSEIESNYTSIKADYDEMKPKYDNYVKAEQEQIAQELDEKKVAEFKKYESIFVDDLDFTALKDKKDEMSFEEIEKECSLLYTRKHLPVNFTATPTENNNSVSVMDDDDNEGYISTKYGNIPVSR